MLKQHVSLADDILFPLLADAVVSEVHELVVQLVLVVIDCRNSHVTLIVVPNRDWIPVGYQHPGPYVKLPPVDNEWVLYVLLDDPGRLLLLYLVQDLFELVVARYSSTT